MPEVTILTAMSFGFLLGVKHALDADHVVAIATIVSRSRSLFRSALVGLSWGIGHTLALFVAGFGVLVLKLTVPDWLALSMEFAVGLLLVVLGVPLFWRLMVSKTHAHLHQHAGNSHFHAHSHSYTTNHDHSHIRRPLLVGMLHGLAGSGVLILLVISSMSSVGQGLFFLLLFGIGSILGMMVFSGLISLPFRLTSGLSLRLNLWFQGVAGCISIVLGILIMWQTGFAGDLFHFTS